VGDVAVPRASRIGHPLDELVAAVAFLSRVPVGGRGASRARTGAAAFGLVGGALGLIAALPPLVLGASHVLLAGIGALAVLAVVDGGLHLDGFADTFDALAAPGATAERARTDPRSGPAGVIAIVGVLALDAASLAELGARGGWIAAATLIAAVAVSRAAAPVWAVAIGRRRRPADGLGAWFAEETRTGDALAAAISAAALTLVLVELGGPLVALAVLAGIVASAIVGIVLIRLRGQLDGDGYGALIEMTLAAILLAAAVLAPPTAG
jgi:adenosylcobinamide-GDP ribazoletransferase